jgi:hypothetical protein
MRRQLHDGSFLLVEGPIDSQIYKQFGHASCRVVVADGRGNVLEVLARLNGEIQGLLGIIDADWDWIEGTPARIPGLIVTDVHDLEMLITASGALDRVLASLGDFDRIEDFRNTNGFSVGEGLLRAAEAIGALRLHSRRTAENLRFENLDFSAFTDPTTLAVDRVALIAEVGRKSQRPNLDPAALAHAIGSVLDDRLEPRQLCCGHDLVGVMSFALRRSVAALDAGLVRSDRLTLSLGLAYDWDEWARTEMYQAIRAWESANKPYRVLRERT